MKPGYRQLWRTRAIRQRSRAGLKPAPTIYSVRRFALLLALLFPVIGAPHALAAGTGSITGILVEKTEGASLQAGGKATLYLVADNQDPTEQSTLDVPANGQFTFNGVPTDATPSYQVLVQYGGAAYISDKITFGIGVTSKQSSIDVYEPTDDDKVLTVEATNIILTAPDANAHELPILELDTFTNGSQRTFIPSTTPRNGGPPNLLRFTLPANSTDLQAGSGIAPDDIIQIDQGFGALTPLQPGRHDLGFSFRTAYQTSSITFTKRIVYPTKTVRVVAPTKLDISSPQLSRQPVTTIGNSTYNVLVGTNLAVGSSLELTIGALPGISPLAFLSQPSTLIWVAVVLMAVVLGLLTWYVRDRTGKRRAAAAAAVATERPSLRRELELEQRELLIALARLDDRFDAGGISADDYHAQRETHKTELKELMKELESLGA